MRWSVTPEWRGLGVALLAVALLFHPSAARAQSTALDPKLALPILLKVITYDRSFDARGGGPFVIMVASEAAQSAARDQILSVLRSLPVSTIKSRPLRFVSVEFKDEPGLSAAVAKEGVSALLAVPGLSRPGLTLLGQVAEAKQLYSLALDSEMVERALALGVANNGGRPQIVINEKAARASGLKFETSVLKLARVVQ